MQRNSHKHEREECNQAKGTADMGRDGHFNDTSPFYGTSLEQKLAQILLDFGGAKLAASCWLLAEHEPGTCRPPTGLAGIRNV